MDKFRVNNFFELLLQIPEYFINYLLRHFWKYFAEILLGNSGIILPIYHWEILDNFINYSLRLAGIISPIYFWDFSDNFIDYLL